MASIQINTESLTTSNCPSLQDIRLLDSLEYKITHKAEKRIKIFCIFHELITRHQMGVSIYIRELEISISYAYFDFRGFENEVF